MEKDYNVDDILSEIKTRKSREKSGVYPDPLKIDQEVTAPEDIFPAQPQMLELEHQPENGGGVGEIFQWNPPAKDEKRKSPLEFTGHVRPITDKAKMRSNRLGRQKQGLNDQSGLDFKLPEKDSRLPGNVESLDFGAFKADPAAEHTRVMPNLNVAEDADAPPPRKSRLAAAVEKAQEGKYYEEDRQDSLSERPSIDFSEYNSTSDRKDVATDIAKVKLWLFIRAGLTAILTFILLYLALSGKYLWIPLPPAIFPEPETMRAYMLACTGVTVLVALVNSSAVGGGILSLFKARANSDTLASLALLASIAQGVFGAVKPTAFLPEELNLYYCIAALSMLFNALGKMNMISRIQANFRVIASDKKKFALEAVDEDDFCREFIPDASRRPTVAFGVQAGFFTDFLGLSYSDKYDVGINRAVAPVCFAGSALVCVVSYLLNGSLPGALSALTAVLCVSATFSATFIENVPLRKLAKKLAPMGGVVSGNKAVEDFCDTQAVILTETDLFPEGSVQLCGIKSYAQGGRIDEAILDAASVICALDGALSPAFLQVIGGNRRLLKKVENIVYESGMGVSAWVASRRVLIGNRKLMQNHGITMPPQAKVSQLADPENGEILYLSNSGEVSAQFTVSYQIDEELAVQLDQLEAKNKLLIIYTCDATITPRRIWELYGYSEDLIRVLPAERHAQYRKMTEPRKTAVAEIVYCGGAPAAVGAVVACINARSSILYATVVQLVQIVLGYGLVAFLSFMGSIGALTIIQICIYQAFWFLAIFVVQKVKQP